MEYNKDNIKLKIAISKIKEENDIVMEKKSRNVLRTTVTALLGILISTGVAFAGTKIYESIWKQPETYNFSSQPSEGEKETAISETEARQKASEFLTKIGLDKEVNDLNLIKNPFDDEVLWHIAFASGTMEIDGEGNFKTLNIPLCNYTIPTDYGITREKAKSTAYELLSKYNTNNDDNEYELVALKGNAEIDKESYIWYADFYKKYDDMLNMYEKISIGWIPTINGLHSLKVENSKYEDNEQVISKEEAIRIAVEKDKQIETRHAITSIEAEIGIDKMNTEVVYRAKDIEAYDKGTTVFTLDQNGKSKIKENAIFYKIGERVRKVWEVTIVYDYVIYEENGPERFVYYVDATTGEIIGGDKHCGANEKIQNLLDEPYNLIHR